MALVMFVHEHLMQAVYFAPRGKKRLLFLGTNIQQRYLSPEDKLIGFVGDAGAGKSLLIRGMFPGLELTNDDDGINIRPLPLMDDADREYFRYHTYHLDVRFESAFTQPWKIAEAIQKAISAGRRVVIEHFDLVYPQLGVNAEVLIGVGEEVIVTRPTVFGPEPQSITDIVFDSIKYRRMAHSAEDITSMILEEMGLPKPEVHSDIKHGFVLELPEKPDIDLDLVEHRVLDLIKADLPICFANDNHIRVGEILYPCTGPRIHIRRSGEIKGFHLLKEFRFDPIAQLYTIAGIVGEETTPARSLDLFGARNPKV
ncbi:alanine-tRNA synthetase second additional domain-containing protein [Desulfosporosinus sp.]|uniref:alanine-tRNA synthetase second additional domain-containing protein n=1 Tax=Desulfosporosinus sp. TaxID=157907 RepID=UPI0025C074E3|nr:alanine-tRNA synthetase second additional domain-containing protein [Desulfosporosinus sp.]MBC2722633.1 alanine-tRNA synthetase second additional domain-containing protein [Desulfosporosinus sp.]MBC2726295.1 alanine-tRNA synthetase second additional domain-containing protein [Desulfosporosinus sp.]